MDASNLVQMANRIGEFFAAMPDPIEAREGVATHLRKFWAPRMRRQILELLDRDELGGLSELVRDALVEHRSELEP
jgi:formate dehydrogenase subunit delta